MEEKNTKGSEASRVVWGQLEGWARGQIQHWVQGLLESEVRSCWVAISPRDAKPLTPAPGIAMGTGSRAG